VIKALIDESDRLYLETDLGLGLVHTSDMALAADAVEQGRWVPEPMALNDMAAYWGFVLSPQRRQSAPAA
jgi:hypothetical protein